MTGLSLLAQTSWLRSEILDRTWMNLFDPGEIRAATEYSRPGRLRYCRVPTLEEFDEEDEEDEIVVEASFTEEDGATTDIALFFDHDEAFDECLLEAECSCACAADDLCEHAAAVLIHLANRLERQTGPQLPATGSDLDFEATIWLETLENAEADAEPAPGSPPAQFVAYCIAPSSGRFRDPELRLHPARRLESGGIVIERRTQVGSEELDAQDDFVPRMIFDRLSAHSEPFSGPARDCALTGAEGHRLLMECLKTSRLFYLPESDEAARVELAPAIEVTPSWNLSPDGLAAPSLSLPAGAVLVPTSPLLALVPPEAGGSSEAQLHPLASSSHSAAVLLAWQRGPAIPLTSLAQLSGNLRRIAAPLPAPPDVREETLKKVRPVPRLGLFRRNPFQHRGLHLSGQPEPIVAKLDFLYHGRAVPVARSYWKKLPNLRVCENNAVLSIPRHKTGEIELLDTLRTRLGLVPADELDPIRPEFRGCFLPDVNPRDWDFVWASIIAKDLPALEAEGWQISIDTTAQFEIHAIGPHNLDTGLAARPDHGIDWFQFEPSYLTPGGEKRSLLPLLSGFLKCVDPALIADGLAAVPEGDRSILRDPTTGAFVSIETRRLLTLVKSIYDLFGHQSPAQPIHRVQAAALADSLELDHTGTHRALAELGRNLKSVAALPRCRPPKGLTATLRDYQLDGFRWMQFLARHSLHGILADDMGLGKTVQALAHLQAEVAGRRTRKRPSLVVAPTSVVGNWASEARKFAPDLKVLILHGPDRKERFALIPAHQLVLTSYALLHRDFDELDRHQYHLLILDEAQHIKNPASQVSQLACQLDAAHRLSLSGTPLENHLGELWSQMRFLMPGLLGSSEKFRKTFRTPIEKHHDAAAQSALNRRVAPLILRRTKEQVATELPPKTEIAHAIPLHPKQIDLYETVRASMDKRVREAIAEKGLAKSHIIVLDALLKLRQICCHPRLLKIAAAQNVRHSSKLDFLTDDLLPTLLEEGRRILLFSSFTSMLAIIEEHLGREGIAFCKIIGSTTNRQAQIDRFQAGEAPLFLISLKAGGTGLNLTAADTVIHYDPWWNPAAENQATDRAHRIGQDKPVFVHKLIAEGSIEERIQALQAQKAALVEALLTDDTNRLRIDQDTLHNLLAPLG